ncbi:hypothetical protein [Actinomycetospora chiangmaiensis]|uniref:hypothetical protein n=1 Tax=Actinomycetospora chiangmaiensis TaxID=402650 RepID=UPI0003AABA69|nr:hypothetical protein [Actinomycetospora chiangmaiensis]
MRASDLRARADEMAALLDEAAPRTRRRRRRRSTALPAAVAAFGALSVGGVGLALGLTPTGAEGQLPAAPSPVLADPGTDLPGTTAGGAGGPGGTGHSAGSGPVTVALDPAVAGADLIRPEERPTAAGGRPAPSSGPRDATTPASTTTTTSTPSPPARSTRPRPTRPPRPTVTRRATPRSTTTAPTASTTPRRIAQRATLPTTSPAPGTGAEPDATDTEASPDE